MRLATRARLYLAPLIFGFLVFNYVYLLSWLLRNYQTYNDEATRLENPLSTGITFYHLDKSTNKPTSVEIIAEADPESAIAVRATYLRNHMFHPMSYRFFSLLMYSFLVVQVTEEQFLRDNLVIATLTTVASSLIIFLEGGLLPMNIFAFWSKGLFDFAIFFRLVWPFMNTQQIKSTILLIRNLNFQLNWLNYSARSVASTIWHDVYQTVTSARSLMMLCAFQPQWK